MTVPIQLVMRTGPTPGASFPLMKDSLTIGRDSSNGIAINDAEVARIHARLTLQGGKYILEDLGSTNGTFVNGQRLAGPVVLKPGDIVSLGESIQLQVSVTTVENKLPSPVPYYARNTMSSTSNK